MFNKLCIFGVGLIGGSVAKAAREKGLAKTIVGIGRVQDAPNLVLAKELRVIDQYCVIDKWPGLNISNDYETYEEALNDADCVLIATPVASIKSTFQRLKSLPLLKGALQSANTLYMDVGSTKGNVIADAIDIFGELPRNFVPAHPIAGAEQSGVQAADKNLFLNKRLIITPVAGMTNIDAIQKATLFWEGLGSIVETLDAKTHDSILAATSHLPHILAFALVDMLGHKDEQMEIFKYAAGGFRDFTRIASSDPLMWKDICAANKTEILPLIEQLQTELTKIQTLLAADDYQQLFNTFAYAKSARQRFLEQFDKQL